MNILTVSAIAAFALQSVCVAKIYDGGDQLVKYIQTQGIRKVIISRTLEDEEKYPSTQLDDFIYKMYENKIDWKHGKVKDVPGNIPPGEVMFLETAAEGKKRINKATTMGYQVFYSPQEFEYTKLIDIEFENAKKQVNILKNKIKAVAIEIIHKQKAKQLTSYTAKFMRHCYLENLKVVFIMNGVPQSSVSWFEKNSNLVGITTVFFSDADKKNLQKFTKNLLTNFEFSFPLLNLKPPTNIYKLDDKPPNPNQESSVRVLQYEKEGGILTSLSKLATKLNIEHTNEILLLSSDLTHIQTATSRHYKAAHTPDVKYRYGFSFIDHLEAAMGAETSETSNDKTTLANTVTEATKESQNCFVTRSPERVTSGKTVEKFEEVATETTKFSLPEFPKRLFTLSAKRQQKPKSSKETQQKTWSNWHPY